MTDLKVECERLRGLGRSRPNSVNRRLAAEALSSKFESLQVEGAKLLGRWGGREAVAALKSWLERSYQKKNALGIRGQAVKALSRCVTSEDAPWVLDLYFSHLGATESHSLVLLICALPTESWVPRIRSEVGSRSAERRRAAALAVARSRFRGRAEILKRLHYDSSPEVRSLAHWQLMGGGEAEAV
jgi:hypothetical protein